MKPGYSTKVFFRYFLQLFFLLPWGFLQGCLESEVKEIRTAYDGKLLVVGVDGLDPVLLEEYFKKGLLPNIEKLLESGGEFKSLKTSFPPQSPVAWSNIAVGANPGHHNIFDFIHRDPETLTPYFSASKTEKSSYVLNIGSYRLPFYEGQAVNLREGLSFWDYLCQAGVKSTICKFPANYPPKCHCSQLSRVKILSGMGTPDILGTQGTSTLYTTESHPSLNTSLGGLNVVRLNQDRSSVVIGPRNPFLSSSAYNELKDSEKWEEGHLNIPFKIKEHGEAWELELPGKVVVLEEGVFTDWIEVEFPILFGMVRVSGIVRFLLKNSSPEINLYASPININPQKPLAPISIPDSYSKELAARIGSFYTQNMPPDTKALVHGALSDEEFIKQVELVFKEEELRLLTELKRFDKGLLFSYFNSIDQVSHVMWRTIDPGHPLYQEALATRYGDTIRDFYQRFDTSLGKALDLLGANASLLIISDHGFRSFRKEVNINSLLWQAGLLRLKNQTAPANMEDIKWSKTKAYALGMNAVYINLEGREKHGIVSAKKYREVVNEVKQVLINTVDPQSKAPPVSKVWTREEIYSGPFSKNSPDIVVGFAEHYRIAWDSILGSVSKEAITDNRGAWSGDHSINPELVPGVVLSNRPLADRPASVEDIAPTILEFFNVESPQVFGGSSLWR